MSEEELEGMASDPHVEATNLLDAAAITRPTPKKRLKFAMDSEPDDINDPQVRAFAARTDSQLRATEEVLNNCVDNVHFAQSSVGVMPSGHTDVWSSIQGL